MITNFYRLMPEAGKEEQFIDPSAIVVFTVYSEPERKRIGHTDTKTAGTTRYTIDLMDGSRIDINQDDYNRLKKICSISE